MQNMLNLNFGGQNNFIWGKIILFGGKFNLFGGEFNLFGGKNI